MGSVCQERSRSLGGPVAGAASKGTLDRASAARSLETALMWAHGKQPVDTEQGPRSVAERL